MRKSLTTLVAVFAFGSLFAEEPTEKVVEFTPSGKAFGQIYANYHQKYIGDSLTSNGFELSRAYFGYGYSMSPNWSAKVKVDVSSYKDESLSEYREVFLKEASLTYKNEALKVDAGLIGLVQHKLQEKYWGHRYVYKSFQDQQKISHSADIGIIVDYKLHDMISVDFTARNGEGYKKLQGDMIFKNQLGLTVTPHEMIVVRAFGTYMPDTVLRAFGDIENPEIVLGGLLGLKLTDKVLGGVEYTWQNNAKNYKDNSTQGYSLYATYAINKKFEVFGRYDAANWIENKNKEIDNEGVTEKVAYEDNSKSNSLIIVGAQYQPIKQVKFALDYQLATKKDNDGESGIYVHADIKF